MVTISERWHSAVLSLVAFSFTILHGKVGFTEGFREVDGQIEWDPFPADPDYQAGRMQLPVAFQDINRVAVAFVQALPPKELPWEIYRGIINGTVDVTDPLVFVDHTVGFMVMFAIAVIFMIFMPLTGIIFCCCRCCDRCGAHMLHSDNDNVPWKRAGLACGILVVSVTMTVGIGVTFIVNQNISTGIHKLEPGMETSKMDLMMYVDQTVEEINFLVDQVHQVKYLIGNKLDNVSSIVGVPVREALDAEIRPSISSVMKLHNDVLDAQALLYNTSDLLDELQFLALILTSSLTIEKNYLNYTLQSRACVMDINCRAARDLLDLDSLSVVTYYNQTHLQEDLMQALDALQSNMTALAIESQAILDSVPQRIEGEAQGHILEIKAMVRGLYRGGIADYVDYARLLSWEVADKINSSFSLESGDKLTQMLYEGIHQATIYEQYRFYAGVGSVCVVIMIILCNYLGVLFGECGRSKEDQPTERSCLANFGGTLLLAGVTFAFLFSGLLMLVTTATFLVGGGAEKALCQPVQTKGILKEVVDYPNLLAPHEHSFLGAFLLHNGDSKLSAEKLIKECEKNAAILTIQDFNVTTHIAEILLDFSRGSFLMETVGLANFTNFPYELVPSLLHMQDTGNRINVSDTLNEVGQSITKVELMDFATILRATADRLSNRTLQNVLRTHAIKLNTLRYEFVLPMRSKVNILERKLIKVQDSAKELSGLINNTLQMIFEAEVFLHEQSPWILRKEIRSFKDHLVGFLEQTADFIIYELTTDVGHCKPIADVYSALDNLLCGYTSDSLNTLWFALGGCVLLLVPSIVFAVKLSKFYRRMKYFEDIYRENGTIPMKAFTNQWNSEVREVIPVDEEDEE